MAFAVIAAGGDADHDVAHAVAPQAQHGRILAPHHQRERAAAQARVLVLQQGLDDVIADGFIILRLDAAFGLAALDVHVDVHGVVPDRLSPRPVDGPAPARGFGTDVLFAVVALIDQEAAIFQDILDHLRPAPHVVIADAAVVGDDHDQIVGSRDLIHDPPDHAVAGFVDAGDIAEVLFGDLGRPGRQGLSLGHDGVLDVVRRVGMQEE